MKWVRWKRLLKAPSIALVSVLALAGFIALTSTILWKNGRLLPWLVEFGARQQVKKTPELGVPATAWEGANRNQALPQTAAELFRATNIWPVTLQFTATQWLALAPRRVPPVANIMQPDGTIVLRNPKAQRSGVAGAIGFDYEWTPARMTVGGKLFSNVAVRLRGNGTYLGSLYGLKHSYKVDLDKFDSGVALAGIRTLNMLNMIEDRAYMSDVLGQELFRDAGVPAPRTAYVWLTIRVEGQWEGKPIGLYALVENVDADFAADRFGSKKTPIFKPVTPDLFKDLGPTWESYADTYDLKTKANQRQKQRVIDFSRLVTHADDAEFARRLSEFLDLDEFGRFLAALVLVANYDSLLTYGQNYYMYLDPRTDKLGFIPWDLDQGWGSFPHFGTSSARERVSIMHPWAGRNRFLERVLAVSEFQEIYRSHVGRLLQTVFVPERLNARIDELAATIRPAIAAESAFRLRLFDQATSTNWLKIARDGGDGPTRPVHQLKRFIANRAKSARDQLEGRARGLILERTADWE
jgi:spore coat protein CotH